MDKEQKLKEGQEVVFQEATFYHSQFHVWGVNVQVVDVLRDDVYRIRPVSGHGTRFVHISQLYY